MKRKGKANKQKDPDTKIKSMTAENLPDFSEELDQVRAVKLHPSLPVLSPPENDEEGVETDGAALFDRIILCMIGTASALLIGRLLGWPLLPSALIGLAVSAMGLMLFWLTQILKR